MYYYYIAKANNLKKNYYVAKANRKFPQREFVVFFLFIIRVRVFKGFFVR